MKIASGLVLAAIAVNNASASSPTYLRSSDSDASTSDKMDPVSLSPIQSNDNVDSNQLGPHFVLDASEKTEESDGNDSHTFDLTWLSDRNTNVADRSISNKGQTNAVRSRSSKDYADTQGYIINDPKPIDTSSTDISLDEDFGSMAVDMESLIYNLGNSQVLKVASPRAHGLSWLSNHHSNAVEDSALTRAEANTLDIYSSKDYLPLLVDLTGDKGAIEGTISKDSLSDEDYGHNLGILQGKISALGTTQASDADKSSSSDLMALSDQYSTDAYGTTLSGDQATSLGNSFSKDYLPLQGGLTVDDDSREESEDTYLKDSPTDENCKSNRCDMHTLITALGKTQVPDADKSPSGRMSGVSDRFSNNFVTEGDFVKSDFGNDGQLGLGNSYDSSLFNSESKGSYLMEAPPVEDSGKEDPIQGMHPLLTKITSEVNIHSMPTIQNPVLVTQHSSVSKYFWHSAKTSNAMAGNDGPMAAKSMPSSMISGEKGMMFDDSSVATTGDVLDRPIVNDDSIDSAMKFEDAHETDSEDSDQGLFEASGDSADPKTDHDTLSVFVASPQNPLPML